MAAVPALCAIPNLFNSEAGANKTTRCYNPEDHVSTTKVRLTKPEYVTITVTLLLPCVTTAQCSLEAVHKSQSQLHFYCNYQHSGHHLSFCLLFESRLLGD
jgi:hypothetical protein